MARRETIPHGSPAARLGKLALKPLRRRLAPASNVANLQYFAVDSIRGYDGSSLQKSRERKINSMSRPRKSTNELTREQKISRLSRAQQSRILKALADPRRFELLERIAKAGCPLGCSEALASLPISAATLSHHVKELETAGLIQVSSTGKFHYLSLRPGVLHSLASVLAALEPESSSIR